MHFAKNDEMAEKSDASATISSGKWLITKGLLEACYSGNVDEARKRLVAHSPDGVIDLDSMRHEVIYHHRKVKTIVSRSTGSYPNATVCLCIAAMRGHVDLCRMLLDKFQADPNKHGDSGFSPLHEAAYYGNFEVVKLFSEQGRSLRIDLKTVPDGLTAEQIARRNGRNDIADFLKQRMKSSGFCDDNGVHCT